MCVTASAVVYLLSPDLVKERVRPGEGEQDRVTVRALNLLMFAQLLLAGLDVGRLHWSATVPFPLQILGLVGFAIGMGLTTWAMLVNRFFSSAVRFSPTGANTSLHPDLIEWCATRATPAGCCCC